MYPQKSGFAKNTLEIFKVGNFLLKGLKIVGLLFGCYCFTSVARGGYAPSCPAERFSQGVRSDHFIIYSL